MAKPKKVLLTKTSKNSLMKILIKKIEIKMLQNTLSGLLTQCIFASIQVFF